MMKVYLLVTQEYYSGYIVYAASESPIHFVGDIRLPYGDDYGRKSISSIEVDETDILRQQKDSYSRSINGAGYGWEVVRATTDKDETKYKYKAVRELLRRK